MRGRPRKASLNQVVKLPSGYGVIVDYRSNKKWGRYTVIRTDPLGAHPHRKEIYVDSADFEPLNRRSYKAGRIFRKNKKLVDRGCLCQCCYHVKGFEPEPATQGWRDDGAIRIVENSPDGMVG